MPAVILTHVNAIKLRDGILSLDSKLGIIPVDFNKSATWSDGTWNCEDLRWTKLKFIPTNALSKTVGVEYLSNGTSIFQQRKTSKKSTSN
jgi:hypothetical protein